MIHEINCRGFYFPSYLQGSLYEAEDARAIYMDVDLGRRCCRITRSANPTYANEINNNGMDSGPTIPAGYRDEFADIKKPLRVTLITACILRY